jgi:hypothetical protein
MTINEVLKLNNSVIYFLFLLIPFSIHSEKIDTKYHTEVFGKPSFNKYGVAFVIHKSDWVAINKKKDYLFTAFNYDNGPDPIQEGLMRYVKDGKMGFVNERGKIIIKAKFDFVDQFENGIANYCIGCEKQKMGEHTIYDSKTGKWGKINKKGKDIK